MSLARNTLLTAHGKQGMLRRGFVQADEVDEFARACIADFDARCGGPWASASSLSGGNLQKFIIGRELMLLPRLLFVS